LLAGFGVLLALVTAEVGVRALHLVPDRFWEPDPLLGTRLIPGKEGWWVQEELEFRVPVKVNSQGLRDVEHPLAKDPQTVRILLLGDSFVEAMQVPGEDTVARQLEEELNRAGGAVHYEVISLGVSGYGTASEALAYREMGRQYDPDLVLVAFYPGNDVRNNSPTLETVLRPVYAPDGSLMRVEAPKRARRGRRSLLGRVFEGSQAYRFFRKMILTRHAGLSAWLRDVGLVQTGAGVTAPTQGGVPLDYWVYAAPPDAEWEEAWRRSESLLLGLRRAVEADGAEFGVLIVAGREQVYPQSWEAILRAHPAMQGIEWDISWPERRLARWCDDNGIPRVRLTEAFRAARDSSAPLHYHYDGHWTAAGHRLAAKTVAKFLRDRGMLLKVED